MLITAALGLLLAIAMALPVWLASVRLHDASIVDRFWAAFITVPAVWYGWRLGADARVGVMLSILLAWAVRLTVHITWRNWGHGEDRRYRKIRAAHEPGFAWKSLWLVFLLQAVLAWVVGLPVLAAVAGRPWGALDTLGLALAIAGLVMEAVADAQLARFRRTPSSGDAVMDRGLWGWSRHPNYFGEACLWWGLGLMALGAGGWASAWCLVSPVLMTLLLLRVSGVTLLEQDIGERRPRYRDYVARTSAFIPWPPRRQGTP